MSDNPFWLQVPPPNPPRRDNFSLNGYYDDEGNWHKTKFCFVSCGHRCDCGPPGGLYYRIDKDKRLQTLPKDSTQGG